MVLLLFTGVLFIIFYQKYYFNISNILEDSVELFTELVNYSEFNEEEKEDIFLRLVSYHKAKGIKFPYVVSAQVIEETGELTSNIFKENHNGYGMKCSQTCLCRGVKRGHAFYFSFSESTDSYLCWQKKRLRDNPWVKTEGDYLIMLQDFIIPGVCNHCRYAENPAYIKNLKKILNKNKNK